VIDRTGLGGWYAVTLRYQPGPLAADGTPGDLPALVTAVREQLGLGFRSSRTVVETFVIDHIERPTDN
jgi:uncharacterized protein (TIGR03435 family)